MDAVDNSSTEAVSGSKEEAVATEESTVLTKQDNGTEKEEASVTEQSTTEPSVAEEPTTQETITQELVTEESSTAVVEVTIAEPEVVFVSYDADRVARLAVDKCKATGMISLPENLDNLLAEGKITQEEYNEYYPYDGCGYYSVFVETNLNLASTISGRRLYSEEEIADYIAGMMVLEVEPYFYIECAGTYQGSSTEFYEFRCYR